MGASATPRRPSKAKTAGRRDAAWRWLWKALCEIDRDLSSQSACLTDYAEHHHANLRVGTALTEATAKFLVNRRRTKVHLMRWSRLGADLLLQVRSVALKGNSVLASVRFL